MTHTPGPWRTSEDGKLPIRLTADEDNRWQDWVTELAQIGGNVLAGPGDFEESLANARLIAAAPDMLAALKKIDRRIDDASGSPTFTATEEAELASLIAKAEGRK